MATTPTTPQRGYPLIRETESDLTQATNDALLAVDADVEQVSLSQSYDDSNLSTQDPTDSNASTVLRTVLTNLKALIGNPSTLGRTLVAGLTPANMRFTLALGNSATRDVGTAAGTVAAGDDPRFASGGAGSSISGGTGTVSVDSNTVTINKPILSQRLSNEDDDIVRDAVQEDVSLEDASDASFTSSKSIETRRKGGLLTVRARVGYSASDVYYGLYVSDIEGVPNATTVAAFFEAANSSANYALKTGAGKVSFGDVLDMNGNPIVNAGNTEFAGARGSSGTLKITDTTRYGGGQIVFAGDDRGQQVNFPFASMRGFKENTTYLDQRGALALGTQTHVGGDGGASDLSTVVDWVFLRSDGVLELKNTSAPTGLRFGDGALWVEGGALKYRGSSGTVTVLAPA